MNRAITLLTSAVLAAALSGCVTYPPQSRTAADLPLAESFTLYGPTAQTPDPWWQAFESPELDTLIERAIDGNFTIEQAVARIRQADAAARQSGSLLYPSIDFGIDAAATQRRVDTGASVSAMQVSTQRLNNLASLLGGSSGGAAANTPLESLSAGLNSARTRATGLQGLLEDVPSPSAVTKSQSYGMGLSASYEVDLWGRIRADEAASIALLDATREDAYTAMHTVAGQVALTWLDLLESRQVLAVLREQLDTNRTNLELITLRYRRGIANSLDVYQQRQAVADTEAAIPRLEAEQQVLEHTLAILLGAPPRAPLGLVADTYPKAGKLPEYGVPADLLAQRPDVRAAGLRLHSADWQVSAARADRLPSLRLSAGAEFSAQDLDLLFSNWITTLASSLTGPIFDGGRRKAEVERTRAVADERLAAYKLVVIQAMGEVEDALIRIHRQEEFIEALERQLEAARNSYREARGRYRNGLTDYLPVLTALRNTQALERSVVESEHDLLVFRVQLHLALGGTWMRTLETDEEETADG